MAAAGTVHLSVELGAFVAGVPVAELRQARDLHTRVRPLVDFPLAVFYVTLGAGMDVGAVGRIAGVVFGLPAFVLAFKSVVVGGLLELRGEFNGREGLTLGQISEFSFLLVGGAAAAARGKRRDAPDPRRVGRVARILQGFVEPREIAVT